MEWMVCPVGPIQANCYLVFDQTTRDCLIIDPGEEFEKIKFMISRERLLPISVFLTHAHFDHIGALDAVRDLWRLPVSLHENEADWLRDPNKNGSAFFPVTGSVTAREADHLLADHQKVTVGPFSFTVLHTPGHSPGGVSFYFEADRVVFCGDALFHGSIGRTDQYGGDPNQLMTSLRTTLMALPDETVVCPGHGPSTTIESEAENNPFLV
ncbi:MBL fold metallo-hydrolase [Sporolactobacillus shoreicorticis]|uniref:MBL fold metallo-hydrolase n=1 Tax=Sporolactobacillus shoreicorticis TaxID=1923877 RepID=A0ABW5S1D8_9BACL|nr:MBL fold metallo-hydrolase [Sporolactobacillus shoreicorticis]MCO7128309.1 MBL fold metallo-hydrolase [Sporolactobacillus shoreicorticis]